MRSFPSISIITAMLIILASCDGRGDDVLSKKKMEDVLFDYHIAQAMTYNLRSEQRDLSDQYIASVFKKHGITEAVFDSSLVYYNRHQDQMSDIYKNLQRRYERLDATLQYTTGNHEMQTAYTATGDTAEIWTAQNLFILRPIPTSNIQTFTLRADTAFFQHDKFRFTASIDFIREDQNDQDVHLVSAITIIYNDDSRTSITREQSYSGNVELYLSAAESKDIKYITGYFYYTTYSSTRSIALIRNISLLRYHSLSAAERNKIGEQPADLQQIADTLISDSSIVPDNPAQRHQIPIIRPNQRQKDINDTLRDARIIEEPVVRTPNSIGPNRRIIRRNNKP